jgi:transposase
MGHYNLMNPHLQGRDIMKNTFIGIDVSKNSFDLCIDGTGRVKHWEYTSQTLKKCVKDLVKLEPELIVMEATGGYEMQLAIALQQAGLPVAVVNPRRVRDFAKALGKMAKTDKFDAIVIADFAGKLKPPATKFITESSLKIKALVTRRSQLITMRIAELNRQENVTEKIIIRSLKVSIKRLTKEIEAIDDELRKCIYTDPEMKENAEIIESTPGIGKTTTAMLISELPELGTLTRRQIASLVGVAPMARDSGTFKGKRMIGGGRANVRTQLYMPILVAIRYNKPIKEFYERLLKAGKTKMTAIVACMRKLLTILNIMVAKKECWKY